MDRFLLFAGDKYYPTGGWFDYQGSYADLAVAITEGKARTSNRESIYCDWCHIVDKESGELVWTYKR